MVFQNNWPQITEQNWPIITKGCVPLMTRITMNAPCHFWEVKYSASVRAAKFLVDLYDITLKINIWIYALFKNKKGFFVVVFSSEKRMTQRSPQWRLWWVYVNFWFLVIKFLIQHVSWSILLTDSISSYLKQEQMRMRSLTSLHEEATPRGRKSDRPSNPCWEGWARPTV